MSTLHRNQPVRSKQAVIRAVAVLLLPVSIGSGCHLLGLRGRDRGDRTGRESEIHALPIAPDVDFVSVMDLGEDRRLYRSDRDLLYAEEDRFYPIVVRGYPHLVGKSPGSDAVAFLEPAEFEMAANLYVFDIPARTLRRLTDFEDGSSTLSVKAARWFDDQTIYYVQGYRYGTVSHGGDLWKVDLASLARTPVVQVMGKEAGYAEIVDFEFVPGVGLIRYVKARYDDYGAETRRPYYCTLDGKPLK